MRSLILRSAVLSVAFIGGFTTHFFYNRWTASGRFAVETSAPQITPPVSFEPQKHRVTYDISVTEPLADLPVVEARDVQKLRGLAGNKARVRGRIFRIGHSAKSNTHFLNFGPSREALTAIVFASALESFEKKRLAPAQFEGKDVEVHGIVKDHPQYGLEIILESPEQIRILN
jgi:hypothetical protein